MFQSNVNRHLSLGNQFYKRGSTLSDYLTFEKLAYSIFLKMPINLTDHFLYREESNLPLDISIYAILDKYNFNIYHIFTFTKFMYLA